MSDHGDHNDDKKGFCVMYFALFFLFFISVIVMVYYRNFQLTF